MSNHTATMLSHAFVIARLLPVQSSWHTSVYGIQVAEKLKTSCFLALRIHIHPSTGAYKSSMPLGPKAIFIISAQKPPAPFQDFYLPLTTGDVKEALKLNYPLPQDGPLYVHTFPLIRQYYNVLDDKADVPIMPSFYQLEPESYHRLISFYRDMYPPLQMRLSGGPERVGEGWDTFSGGSGYQLKQPGTSFLFAFFCVDDSPISSAADVWRELLILTRLWEEYSWHGVTRTIDWLYNLRCRPLPILPFIARTQPLSVDLPALLAGRIERPFPFLAPVDAEPKPTQEASDSDDSGDSDDDSDWLSGAADFVTVQLATTVIPGEIDLRIAVFDICGAVLDFNSASLDAVLHLGVPYASAELYVARLRELQALEAGARSATHVKITRHALHALAKELPAVSRTQLEEAVHILVKPRLVPDIEEALTALHRDGFAIFGYSTLDAAASQALVWPLVSALPVNVLRAFDNAPGLFLPCTEAHMELLLERIRSSGFPDLLPEETVLVSPSSVRALESATAIGMATALLAIPSHLEVEAVKEHSTVQSTMVAQPRNLASIICSPASWRHSEPLVKRSVQRVRGLYEVLETLQWASSGVTVCKCISWLTNEFVAVKYELPPRNNVTLTSVRHEMRVYAQFAGCKAIPRIHWSGSDGGADVLVMDLLGPTLEHLRRACRGSLSLKSVLMIGIQLLDFIEFAHSRGIILRDIKPQNTAVGRAPELAGTIFNFDFGNARAYIDPHTGAHIPLRTGRKIAGTVRFCSHWAHQGLESSCRDDIVTLGHTLLHLFHGRLPWQGIYAPNHKAKLKRVGEMKDPHHPAMTELLARSPAALSGLMAHAYGLEFTQKPDYMALRELLGAEMAGFGWINDGMFDWVRRELAWPRGTLIPCEYRFAAVRGALPPSREPYFDSLGNRHLT